MPNAAGYGQYQISLYVIIVHYHSLFFFLMSGPDQLLRSSLSIFTFILLNDLLTLIHRWKDAQDLNTLFTIRDFSCKEGQSFSPLMHTEQANH